MTSSGRDNLRHIAQRQVHDGGEIVDSAMSRLQGKYGSTRAGRRATGTENYPSISSPSERLGGESRGMGDCRLRTGVGSRRWRKLLAQSNLKDAYAKWFERDQQHDFVEQDAQCFTIWDNAPADVTGGHHTIRGGPVSKASTQNGTRWMLAPPPFCTNLELYSTPEACRSRIPGPAGVCTLGKVALFVRHRENPPQGRARGTATLWVAVAEYVTTGPGQQRDDDLATGHPVMRLKQSLALFPDGAIWRVGHMYHRCTTACKAVKENGGASTLRHKYSLTGNNYFLYNEHFHITGA